MQHLKFKPGLGLLVHLPERGEETGFIYYVAPPHVDEHRLLQKAPVVVTDELYTAVDCTSWCGQAPGLSDGHKS